MSARRLQRGFTLIEVVIAFAVLALALTFMLGTLSGSARQMRRAADASRAALHAQSLLDGLGIEEGLKAGSKSGEFEDGRYRWSLRVEPFTDPREPPQQPVPVGPVPQLLQVSLAVEWGDAGPAERLRVDTLRLIAPSGPGF